MDKSNLILDAESLKLREQASRWKARATQLCGTALVLERDADGLPNGNFVEKPMSEAVQGFFSRLILGLNDSETIRQRNELLARAEHDPKVKSQLMALRIEGYRNYIVAHQNFIPFFFEGVDLKPEERPVAQNETTQEIMVRAVGDDASARRVRIVKPQEEELIPLIWLSTDTVEYTVVDIYRGNVVSAALATIRIGYDMANQREKRCFDLLNTASVFRTSFDTANAKKVLRNYVPNSRIIAGNLPAGNDITVADSDATSKFRTQVLAAISQYCNQWNGAFPDGDLIPTGRVLVPGGDIAGLASEAPVSGQQSNPVADAIMEQGYTRIHYLGRDWSLVPDNTIALGTCYPEFNRKVGRVYSKPSLDKELINDTMEMQMKNRESRAMRAPFGAYINASQLPFVARFKYRTP